jgi:hypothetical protein
VADKGGVLESAQYLNEVSHQTSIYCNRTGKRVLLIVNLLINRIHECMCRSMYVCMCDDVLSGSRGCERFACECRRGGSLTMREGKFDVGMKVVCYNKKWGPSHVDHAACQVILKTGGAI